MKKYIYLLFLWVLMLPANAQTDSLTVKNDSVLTLPWPQSLQANIDTFLTEHPLFDISQAGFMIYDSDTLVLNGTTFTRDYAEYSYSEADGYVKKVPGEYNMFYVAQWWENGVWKTFTCVQAV